MAETELLELDTRGRATLTRFARHARYAVTVEPDGTIILTPAGTAALLERVEHSRAHPEELRERPRR